MRNRGKVHYSSVDRANESDNMDYWSNTACGLKETEAPLSDKPTDITCKNCLKKIKPNNHAKNERF